MLVLCMPFGMAPPMPFCIEFTMKLWYKYADVSHAFDVLLKYCYIVLKIFKLLYSSL